jgi:hypothetical protein
MLKPALPLVVCALLILYCGWMFHFRRTPFVPRDPTATVEITVRGPDGEVIPPVRRAP